MAVSILLILLLLNCSDSHMNSLMPQTDLESVMIEATNMIIKKSFLNLTSTANFVVSLSSNEAKIAGEELLNKISRKLHGTLPLRIERPVSFIPILDRRTYNTFLVENYNTTLTILNSMTLKTFRYDGFYIIIMVLPSKSIYTDVHSILTAFWKNFIVNVNVITYKANRINEAFLYTYYPFSQHFCGKVYPVIANEYRNNDFIRGYDFFPQKMVNLYKCPLNVALFEFPPYVLLERQKNRKYLVSGTDGSILTELSYRMNFTIERKVVTSKRLWGDVEDNGTSTGAIKMVMERKVHMAIGFYMASIRRNTFMKSSCAYTVANLVWIVPPGQTFTAFEKLFKPFAFYTWTSVITTFSISVLIVILLKFTRKAIRNFVYGKNYRTPLINILNIYFGGPSLSEPKNNFARTLLMIFLLYCLVMRSAYQSGLFKFLQMDAHEPPVSTFLEMIEDKFDFYVVEAFLDQISNMPGLMSR